MRTEDADFYRKRAQDYAMSAYTLMEARRPDLEAKMRVLAQEAIAWAHYLAERRER